MKSILIWILAGALLGGVAASFVVPPMLSWYNEAGYLSQGGGQPAAMVNLPQVVRYATTRLIRGQAIGAGVGAVVFFALGLASAAARGTSRSARAPQRVP